MSKDVPHSSDLSFTGQIARACSSGTNLLCEKDVGKMLNVSTKTVQRARLDGSGPPWLKIRGTIRYRHCDVIDYVVRLVNS